DESADQVPEAEIAEDRGVGGDVPRADPQQTEDEQRDHQRRDPARAADLHRRALVDRLVLLAAGTGFGHERNFTPPYCGTVSARWWAVLAAVVFGIAGFGFAASANTAAGTDL